MHNSELLKVVDLRKYFPATRTLFGRVKNFVKAVDDVSFTLNKGESLGIVGESGSGKTTLARLILRLVEPTSGEIYFDGVNILSLQPDQMRKIRPKMQMVFQDPMASLNPRKRVRQTLKQVYKLHTDLSDDEIQKRMTELLEKVGLSPPELFLERYPHELSGGQRQRICIARAIALKPLLLIADEPVSALDVSIRGQIINLLLDIKKQFPQMAYIVISHDIALIKAMCQKTLVMYAGKAVEYGRTEDIIRKPLHPYTSMLLSAVPIPDPELAKTRNRVAITGETPSLINPPSGCRFNPRCPYVMEKCKQNPPPYITTGDRKVSCFLYEQQQS
ncbi:MAG: ABC transporter ATP-binding protein [Candidatus Caldarchaeum sp.]|nr:ABC transporter ATP-binding protein [Candidatus Caldarchaeum sp.]